MQLLFYRAIFGTVFDGAVALSTFGPFSHVEIEFIDGACFSSSPREGGVRYKAIRPRHHWRRIWVDASYKQELIVRDWCDQHVGCGYDWMGIFRAAALSSREDPSKWFCSEICIAALQSIDFEPVDRIIPSACSPNALYRHITKGSRNG